MKFSAYDRDAVAESVMKHREACGLSTREAAEASGVSQQGIYNYERNRSGMSFESAWKLANLYGCTLDELGGRVAVAGE